MENLKPHSRRTENTLIHPHLNEAKYLSVQSASTKCYVDSLRHVEQLQFTIDGIDIHYTTVFGGYN